MSLCDVLISGIFNCIASESFFVNAVDCPMVKSGKRNRRKIDLNTVIHFGDMDMGEVPRFGTKLRKYFRSNPVQQTLEKIRFGPYRFSLSLWLITSSPTTK